MPKTTIILARNPNQRNFGTGIVMTKDAIVSGLVPIVATNSLVGEKAVYLQKRVGWEVSISGMGSAVCTAIFYSPSTQDKVSAFEAAGGGSTIWKDNVSQGTLAFTASATHTASHISETVISGITYYLITAHNRTNALSVTSGWYLASDASSQTAYTGDTHSNTVIDNIASTAGMYVGQLIAGTGIPADTRIASITSGTAITITNSATATAAGVSLTKTPVALIIASGFPTRITGQFVDLNGRVFIMTQAGRIYQSGMNSVTTWAAAQYMSADLITDVGIGLSRIKNSLVAFGTDSAEVLENVGNPSGSVLLSRQGEAIGVGSFRTLNSPHFNSLIANDLFRVAWISQTGNDSSGVWLLDREGLKKIGGQVITKAMRGTGKQAISIFSSMGQSFVHVSTGRAGAENILYSIENEMWLDANFSDQYLICGAPVLTTTNKVIAAEMTDTNGIVYSLDESTALYQDNGVNYAWTVTTDKYAINDGEPFIITHMDLLADTQSSGSVTASISEDDYATFADLGTFDLTQQIKRIDGCGYFNSEVAFKLTRTANSADRLQALIVYWKPCGRPN